MPFVLCLPARCRFTVGVSRRPNSLSTLDSHRPRAVSRQVWIFRHDISSPLASLTDFKALIGVRLGNRIHSSFRLYAPVLCPSDSQSAFKRATISALAGCAAWLVLGLINF